MNCGTTTLAYALKVLLVYKPSTQNKTNQKLYKINDNNNFGNVEKLSLHGQFLDL